MIKNIALAVLGFFYLTSISAQEEFIQGKINTSKRTNNYFNVGFLQSSIAEDDFYSLDGDTEGFNVGFTSGLILSGVDANGNVSTSVNTYNPEGEYLPGILNEVGIAFEENADFFNRIWSISSEEITLVEKLFGDNQITIDDLPLDIKEWPAKGNPYFDYNITQDLAPFYDHDNDNIYDPINGDLPIPIEESANFIPTKFNFCVYHTITQPAIQISQINYTLDCSENDLQNSIFTRLKITNKSLNDLVEFKLGIYKDFDLGCYEDDFVGSHQGTNSVYAYNSEGIDITQCQGGAVSMPENISAIYSTIFISHPLHSCVPEYRFSNSIPFPTLPIEYHRVLNGTFADGTPMTYGESGFNPASTDVTKYIFSDLPNDPVGWKMYDSNFYDFTDTRLIPSIDLENLNLGASKVVDLVDVVLPYDKTDYTIFDDYESRVANITNLREMSVNQEIDCYVFSHCEEDCVWPGDVNGNGRVEADDLVYAVSMIGDNIPNATERSRITSDWFGFESESWQDEEAGIDYKYGDVNGNGNITSFDLSLLVDNFKLQNSEYEKQEDIKPDFDPMGLAIEYSDDEMSTDGNLLDRTTRIRISLGDENQNISSPLIAISFDLVIDTNRIFFSPWFNSEGNLFSSSENYFELEKVDYSNEKLSENFSSRSSHVSYELSEEIESGGIIYNEFGIAAQPGTTGNVDGQEYISVEFANIIALDKDGNRIDVGSRVIDSILITGLTYDPALSAKDDNEHLQISVFPNPVTDKLFVRVNEIDKGIIKVTNLQGKLIHTKSYNNRDIEIDTRNWNKGAYLINLSNSNKSVTKKIMKF